MSTYKNLEELLQSAESPIDLLQNSDAGAYSVPLVPVEFTSWRNEQRAWRETVALANQSYNMGNLTVKGRDAVPLIKSLGANSFEKFSPGQAKQLVVCNYDGYLIGDLILFHIDVDELVLVGRPATMNWVQFHAETGGYDVQIHRRDRAPQQSIVTTVERDYYRFQIQGPNAPALLEKLNGGPLPDIKFFRFGDVKIGDHKVSGLRHSMSGVPGLEIWGPYAEGQKVHATILAAGKEFGLVQVGARAYATLAAESGWIPASVPAVYTGDKMKAYREWLPANAYESKNSIGGSFYSPDIEDYYVTPFELGYGSIIKFDHDFIGRDALERMATQPHRRKVTLVWDPEDVKRIVSSAFVPGTEPYKYLDFPIPNYAHAQYDRVMRGDKVVGLSMFYSYSYNERAMLSLAIVDPDVNIGDILTLVWGEESGGTRKTTVEPHKQTEVRVKVAGAPYTRDAHGNRVDWSAR
jgi:vanillate/3-O-methylgallate O-demethylase